MKSVLLSIRPRWCELIASGKKTIEVRKTRPKLETPFKCYIYCTEDERDSDRLWILGKQSRAKYFGLTAVCCTCGETPKHDFEGNGKVIGEFVCDGVYENISCDCEGSCVSASELKEYANGKTLYGWHISDLKLYDELKGLGEFHRKCESLRCEGCEHLKYQRVNSSEYDYDCEYLGYQIPLTRPPQSWCYVEEL